MQKLLKSIHLCPNHLLHFFVEIRFNALRFIEFFILGYSFCVGCISGNTTGTLQNVIPAESQELAKISVICCQIRRSLARIERTRSSSSRK